RFFLWIDGVGGYLVCQGNRLTFGQAGLDARVDVPLVADVSRLHATVSRDAEGYLLEAGGAIQGNGATGARAVVEAGGRGGVGGGDVPVPVRPAGAGQHDGPAGPGERAPAGGAGGRGAPDGRHPGAGQRASGARAGRGAEAAGGAVPPPGRAGDEAPGGAAG